VLTVQNRLIHNLIPWSSHDSTRGTDSLGKLSELKLRKGESFLAHTESKDGIDSDDSCRTRQLPRESLSKWPVMTRPCYQLAIIPVCIQERKQNVFEWLYSRLGNSRFRGCMHGDAVYPLWYTCTCTWNPMWVACVFVHTHEASLLGRSLLIAHTWYAYGMRTTRLPKAALRLSFKGAISWYFRGIDTIFFFQLHLKYVNAIFFYRLLKFVTIYIIIYVQIVLWIICKYYLIKLNWNNVIKRDQHC